KEIAQRLARAEGLTDDEAHALAAEGRAVVWIDGGLHADEVLGSHQLIEMVYQLVSRNDPETLRLLRDVIILAVHANPDGHELVANWYMREADPRRRTLVGVPRLYQKYTGHDNNRDFYSSTQAETINMNRILYEEWFPQIVYNHHQSGPAGTVMFAPPFRAPFNYVFDPLIPVGIDRIAAAMHGRFAAEGKPGVTMRSGSNYSTWWNGGLRTTAYFHNQIGLLTEAIGDPTPIRIPLVPEKQIPTADLPYPIAPQTWRFRQSIEYSMTANRAVLDAASRNREALLFDIYQMGRNSIVRGSTDSWTPSPHRHTERRALSARDPRGYILSANQPDFPTATKFVNALIRAGIVVRRATMPFIVGVGPGAKRYPAGSYVVKTAQAFRPHILDMFEPQDHPDDIPYPGAPPTPPYDTAGWTLAYQMGVEFDRVLEGFEGPFEAITGLAAIPRGEVVAPERTVGYLVSHHPNDAFVAVNRLLAAGEDVYWLRDRSVGSAGADAAGGRGQMYIVARPSTLPILRKAAGDLGLQFTGVATKPAGDVLRLRPVRVGLWDRYGGSSESGWVRWVLERFEFPFEIVYPGAVDAGHLAERFDVLIFPDGAIPGLDGTTTYIEAPPASSLPTEYLDRVGTITVDKTIPQLKAFVEAGGTLLAIGRSTAVGSYLGLPIEDALVGIQAGGRTGHLSRDQYYVPGSVLRVRVDNTVPLAYGFGREVDVFFDNSPVFRLRTGAAARGITSVAAFASAAPLRSGWAWGESYLDGGIAVVDAPLGRGRVLLFGPEITFRGQSHGTFKFLFNGVFLGKAEPARIP
ncbi:MAG: M14 family metallopeptidase, partial [Vicinamibacterales bacterium]